MLNKHKIIIGSILVFLAASTTVILNLDSDNEVVYSTDHEVIDFAPLSDSDIDLIEAVKEKMKAAVPSAHAAE
jgi:hypothetical protein